MVAQVISTNLSRLVENRLACELYFKRDILPALESDLKQLEEFGKIIAANAKESDEDVKEQFIEDWIPKYRLEAKKLLQAIMEIADYHANRTNTELNSTIGIYAHKNERLAVNALSVAISASSPYQSSTLIGVKSIEELDQAISTWSRLPILTEDKLDDIFFNPALNEY